MRRSNGTGATGEVDALAVIALTAGTHLIETRGQGDGDAEVLVRVALAGDVDGNRSVTEADLALLRAMLHSRTGEPAYAPEGDSNADGSMTSFDFAQALHNLGVSLDIQHWAQTVDRTPRTTGSTSPAPAATASAPEDREQVRLPPPDTAAWDTSTPQGGWSSRAVSFSRSQVGTFSPSDGWDVSNGDFDGNGIGDVMAFHPADGSLWLNLFTLTGLQTRLVRHLDRGDGWTHFVGDFDGNAWDDLVHFNSTDGRLLLSLADMVEGFLAPQLIERLAPPAGWVTRVGDFNGDGLDDLVHFHDGDGSSWLNLSGGAGFEMTRLETFSPAGGWAHHVGDFNGDGLDDLTHFHAGDGSWWLSTSVGSSFRTSRWDLFTPAPAGPRTSATSAATASTTSSTSTPATAPCG